jgi:membrane-bound lytic murein transglycosylase B
MKLNQLIFSLTLFFPAFNCQATFKDQNAINTFIGQMRTNHDFKKTDLERWFDSVEIKESILKAISKPAEGMPWHKYRKIFITDSRIEGGVKFWKENEDALNKTSEQYGVPPEIIVAIIGVETLYGKHTGTYRVIDALSTLGFNYPKRSKFFLRELESFLLLCRSEKMNPLEPTGSYAGAMGLPQFMPSSYIAYAADFEGDEKRDIWKNSADAIASVGNYFAKHRWKKDQPVVFPVTAQGSQYKKLLSPGLKPDTTIAEIQKLKITLVDPLPAETKVKLLEFEQPDTTDLWLGLNNFYVITRYNRSPLYAMAVYQLSQAIFGQKNINPASFE